MTTFELWISILSALIVAIFYKVYFKQNRIYFIVMASILFGMDFCYKFKIHLDMVEPVLLKYPVFVPLVIALFIAMINYFVVKKNFYELLFVSSMERIMVQVSSMIVSLIINGIIGDFVSDDCEKIINIIYIIGFCLLLGMLLYGFTKLHLKLNDNQWKLLSLVSLLILFIFAMFAAMMCGFIVFNINAYFIFIGLIVLIDGIMIYLIKSINEQVNENQALSFAIEKLNSDKIQYNYLQKINEEVRMIRHDIKHQNLLINNYLDNHEYNQIKELITDNLNKLNTQISFIDVGNDIINMVINNKMMLANSKRIKFVNKVENDLVINVKDFDLNILLGNILDNAIENCYEDGMIEIIIKRINNQLLIEVKNSIIKNNIDLSTSKNDKENHGFGIKSIKRIVRVYHGDLQIFEEDGYFVVSILIKG